ncbi:gametogenetin-binding protein 2-like [Chrysoperla carnea]|uniref:gametogenetin-binding protein 2-like n=1 Tax=Chrysoperla carnea TaxID=189513 RepID=UPI001D096924|nr:gametogenetin-binding protein 2-like [Chrysoperla carnea]
MAKLVDVYRNETVLGRRQLPLIIDENLTMVMDLNSMGLVNDNTNIRGRELDDIVEKLKLLSPYELKSALKVSILDIRNVLDQAVPCVGCRRSVERLFFQILRSGFPTLDPIIITKGGILTIREDKIKNPQVLCNLFHGHATRLNNLVDSQPRSKKSRRCLLHSLESQRPRPVTPAWRDVWECMRTQCKDEVVLIEASSLHATLENYLRKHRFCAECRTKVLKAYTLLVEEPDPCKEKGYVASLYSGIKRCIPDKHLHLQTKTDYIANLIVRAEPEIMGSRRERHAKTLEIAQEEVLTCLGICIYERLHRVYMRLREEECTCQVLAAVAVDCLCRSFETAVEVKRGVTRLEQLYEELTREEQLKIQRKENKKLKRRRKKERKAENEEKENCEDCHEEITNSNESLDNDYICAHLSPKKIELKVKDCLCNNCDKKPKAGVGGGGYNKNDPTVKNKELLNGNCNRSDNKKSGKLCTSRGGGITEVRCNNSTTILDEKCNLKTTSADISSLSPCQSCQCENEVSDICEIVAEKGERTTLEGWSSSEHSQDCGYSSENNNGCCDTASGSSIPSSPEGSEVACSEGFCNHEGGECHNIDRPPSSMLEYDTAPQSTVISQSSSASSGLKLTLQQMLDSCSSDDEEGEEQSYIPAEEVLEFKSKVRHLTEKRQELRQTLKTRFAQLCFNVPKSQPRMLPVRSARTGSE